MVRILLAILVFGILGFSIYQLLLFIFSKTESFNGQEGRTTKKIKNKVEGVSPTTINIILSILFILAFLLFIIRL